MMFFENMISLDRTSESLKDTKRFLAMHSNLAAFYTRRSSPLVFGHRGTARQGPENTIVSFRKAIECGAQAMELDVQVSADGVPFVFHDDRSGATTQNPGERVRNLPWTELAKLNLAPPQQDFLSQAEQRVPSLEAVLTFFSKHPNILVNIELKGNGFYRYDVRAAVLRTINQSSCRGQILLSSFSPRVLRRLRREAPRFPLAYLVSRHTPTILQVKWLRSLRPDAIHPDDRLVSKPALEKWQKMGLPVNVWTVNNPERIACLKSWGIDGIISDYPERCL